MKFWSVGRSVDLAALAVIDTFFMVVGIKNLFIEGHANIDKVCANRRQYISCYICVFAIVLFYTFTG